jgi:hypothetical protein
VKPPASGIFRFRRMNALDFAQNAGTVTSRLHVGGR